MIAVAWLSLAPHDAIPEVDVWDKLVHFLVYAALAVFGGFAFSAGRTGVTVGVLLITYGCMLEIAQIYVPGRSGTVADAIADGLGVLSGMFIVRILRTILTTELIGR